MAGAARPVPGRVGVIVVAAGQSRRMEGIDKLFALLLGRPLLSHLLDGFCASPLVDEIVLVLGQETMDAGKALAQDSPRRDAIRFCLGGERRQDSVRRGLDALSPCEWVAVHDGARPLAGAELLAKGLEAAQETGAAVPVIPLSDTVKMVDSEGWVVETPRPRTALGGPDAAGLPPRAAGRGAPHRQRRGNGRRRNGGATRA